MAIELERDEKGRTREAAKPIKLSDDQKKKLEDQFIRAIVDTAQIQRKGWSRTTFSQFSA